VLTIFDWFAGSLFVATAAMYLVRLRHERPAIAPYVLIGLACIVGRWLGEEGGYAIAISLLVAGSFLLLHLASLPYPEEGEERGRR
jgi:hypothetical protein